MSYHQTSVEIDSAFCVVTRTKGLGGEGLEGDLEPQHEVDRAELLHGECKAQSS